MASERTSLTSEAAGWACAMAALTSLSACSGGEKITAASAGLVAVCGEADGGVPSGAWVCPADRTVECDQGDGTAAVDWIYVVPPPSDGGSSCAGHEGVVVDDPGPFTVGTHAISVTQPGADGGTDLLCVAQLFVVDTAPPIVTAKPDIVLWPPNHQMHAITIDDCVSVEDRCDGVVQARFVSVSSNEPDDAHGDGNSTSDGVFDDSTAHVRAERQGGGGGRVYRLGYEAHDAAGNGVQGDCIVRVPHDASGKVR